MVSSWPRKGYIVGVQISGDLWQEQAGLGECTVSVQREQDTIQERWAVLYKRPTTMRRAYWEHQERGMRERRLRHMSPWPPKGVFASILLDSCDSLLDYVDHSSELPTSRKPKWIAPQSTQSLLNLAVAVLSLQDCQEAGNPLDFGECQKITMEDI